MGHCVTYVLAVCQSDGSQLSGINRQYIQHTSAVSTSSLLLTSNLKLTIPAVQGMYYLCKTQFLELPRLSDRSECVKSVHQTFMQYFTIDTQSNPRIILYLPVMLHFMPSIHAHYTHQSNKPCFSRPKLRVPESLHPSCAAVLLPGAIGHSVPH